MAHLICWAGVTRLVSSSVAAEWPRFTQVMTPGSAAPWPSRFCAPTWPVTRRSCPGSAATDELTNLVTPAQQMRCAVHYLPFFLPLPLPGVGLMGTDDVTEGETTVFAVVGVGVVEVLVVSGAVFVPASPPERAKTARTPSATAATRAVSSQAGRRLGRHLDLPGGCVNGVCVGMARV